MKTFLPKSLVLPVLAACVALLFTGCATTKKVDWNSRVGSYTYDQAVGEMGPPDKQAKTSDGQTVAEWVWRHSGGSSISFGTGFYGRHTGVAVGQTIGSGYQESVTRLTFGPDGRLVTWSRNY
jgi:hypothetical protein